MRIQYEYNTNMETINMHGASNTDAIRVQYEII